MRIVFFLFVGTTCEISDSVIDIDLIFLFFVPLMLGMVYGIEISCASGLVTWFSVSPEHLMPRRALEVQFLSFLLVDSCFESYC